MSAHAMGMATFTLFAIAIAFGGCLAAIALCDLYRYTIPNTVSAALLWLFLVAVPFARVDISLLAHLSSFLIVLGAGLVAFRFGVFGGGDVKSWAAVAAWYNLHDLPVQVFYVTLIGGGLGLLVLGLRHVAARQYVQNHALRFRVPRLLRMGEPVPYGLAIAAGTLLTVDRIDLFRLLQG